jgi:hypothetical protein
VILMAVVLGIRERHWRAVARQQAAGRPRTVLRAAGGGLQRFGKAWIGLAPGLFRPWPDSPTPSLPDPSSPESKK